MSARIVTLTMNPALDVSTSAERIVPEHKLRCAPATLHAGGGGVNVARALRHLGEGALAIYPLGGLSGRTYRAVADASGVTSIVIPIAGETRESFTFGDRSTGAQYRFVVPGPALTQSEWRRCLSTVAEHLAPGGYLVASGSLPPGVPDDFLARLARVATAHAARLIVDSSGPALSAALAEGVYAVKPSRRELEQLVGAQHPLDDAALRDAARGLVREGRAEIVALSLGADGALLAAADGTRRVPTPAVRAVSTVGAGDAFLAGLLVRLAHGRPLDEALRTAVAAGSAATLGAGTELCRPADVERLEAALADAAPAVD